MICDCSASNATNRWQADKILQYDGKLLYIIMLLFGRTELM